MHTWQRLAEPLFHRTSRISGRKPLLRSVKRRVHAPFYRLYRERRESGRAVFRLHHNLSRGKNDYVSVAGGNATSFFFHLYGSFAQMLILRDTRYAWLTLSQVWQKLLSSPFPDVCSLHFILQNCFAKVSKNLAVCMSENNFVEPHRNNYVGHLRWLLNVKTFLKHCSSHAWTSFVN